jgi:deazaflavin-dependent oxidoreductase (nitroreductase family)
MHRRTSAALVVAVLLARAAGAAPAIDDMSVRERSTLDLITIGRTSGKPHSATIWFVYEQGPPRIYVQSGKDGQTDWYRNLLKSPAVTVKIGDRQFRGRARPIDDTAETVRVRELFKRKYLTARIMSWFGGGFGAGKVVLVEGLEPSP